MPKGKVRQVAKGKGAGRPATAPRPPDEWERGWQRTWKKLGFVPYELPADDSPAGQEQDFLMNPRTADGERERLTRIQEEFERGFRALARLGPEAATLIQCGKIGPFPLVLVGSRFWEGLRRFGRFMVKEGVFAADELGFGHVTDSPREAVDRVVRALPPAVRGRLAPVAGAKPGQPAR